MEIRKEAYIKSVKSRMYDEEIDIVARLKELKSRRTFYLEDFTPDDLEIIREDAPEEYALLGHRAPIDDSDFHREDFTEKELAFMERLAPVEYRRLKSRKDEG